MVNDRSQEGEIPAQPAPLTMQDSLAWQGADPFVPQVEPSLGERLRSFGRFLRRYPAGVVGLIILSILALVALFPSQIAPYDPLQQDLRASLLPPSAEHYLGTDEFGRDIFSRIVHGSRISLAVAIGANIISGLAGIIFGVRSGYFGGITDFLEMRLLDLFLAFPGILLAIVIVAVIGPGLLNLTIAVSLFSFPLYARVARSETLALREKEFVQAARSIGASDLRIITRHILPNALGSLLVILCISVANALLTASSLSFLGLGPPPSVPEWGAMLSAARSRMIEHPNLMLFPGLAISISVLAFNLVSQMVTDFADPFRRGR